MLITLEHVLYIFGISMVPIIELRGAILVGAAMELPWYATYLAAVCGNLLPVPFILLFVRRVVSLMERSGHFQWFLNVLKNKVRKYSGKILQYATWGLLIFVAIPLPGTGAWTGALIAAFLDMRMKFALPSIGGGVLCAGLIMTLASYGMVDFLQYIL